MTSFLSCRVVLLLLGCALIVWQVLLELGHQRPEPKRNGSAAANLHTARKLEPLQEGSDLLSNRKCGTQIGVVMLSHETQLRDAAAPEGARTRDHGRQRIEEMTEERIGAPPGRMAVANIEADAAPEEGPELLTQLAAGLAQRRELAGHRRDGVRPESDMRAIVGIDDVVEDASF